MTTFTKSIDLDLDEGYLETEATFYVDVVSYLSETGDPDQEVGAEFFSAPLGGLTITREMLIDMIGKELVLRIEAAAVATFTDCGLHLEAAE